MKATRARIKNNLPTLRYCVVLLPAVHPQVLCNPAPGSPHSHSSLDFCQHYWTITCSEGTVTQTPHTAIALNSRKDVNVMERRGKKPLQYYFQVFPNIFFYKVQLAQLLCTAVTAAKFSFFLLVWRQLEGCGAKPFEKSFSSGFLKSRSRIRLSLQLLSPTVIVILQYNSNFDLSLALQVSLQAVQIKKRNVTIFN